MGSFKIEYSFFALACYSIICLLTTNSSIRKFIASRIIGNHVVCVLFGKNIATSVRKNSIHFFQTAANPEDMAVVGATQLPSSPNDDVERVRR